MKRILTALICAIPLMAFGQYTFDALQYSSNELRGTSRFISMGGAFTALGGDISTLSQNPGGLGVYRSSDVGITVSLDNRRSKPDGADSYSQTKFFLNNVGYVGSLKVDSEVLKYLNWGFSYGRANSFHRRYMGSMNNISSTMTNFMADLATKERIEPSSLYMNSEFDSRPFENTSYAFNVLAYNNGMILPVGGTNYQGLGLDGTTGYAEYEVDEWGETDEYNIDLGGNISDMLYWGLGFGLTTLDYKYYNYYGEDLQNTEVLDNPSNTATIVNGNANFGLVNNSRTKGNGYNFKMGIIFKPVNALRIGAAFHTPTFYELTDYFDANMSAETYGDDVQDGSYKTQFGSPYQEYRYRIKTPWRFMGGLAVVVGNNGIISADYEYVDNKSIKICSVDGRVYPGSEEEMKTYLKPTHIFRVGAEYRVTNNLSLRLGYQHQTSQVEKCVENANEFVVTSGYNPSYKFDNSNDYFSGGLGYRYKSFYLDLAYLHRTRNSEYHAFSPIEYTDGAGRTAIDPGLFTGVKDNYNSVSLTLGFRF
ncbi:MAG: outer membrane protein transport protein [Muribaculaceae bacterium]|nr:outer membrane protein transport protein [Muribaculaceae bacterium]